MHRRAAKYGEAINAAPAVSREYVMIPRGGDVLPDFCKLGRAEQERNACGVHIEQGCWLLASILVASGLAFECPTATAECKEREESCGTLICGELQGWFVCVDDTGLAVAQPQRATAVLKPRYRGAAFVAKPMADIERAAAET